MFLATRSEAQTASASRNTTASFIIRVASVSPPPPRLQPATSPLPQSPSPAVAPSPFHGSLGGLWHWSSLYRELSPSIL